MGRMMLERFLIAVSVAIALCSGSPQTGTFTTRDGSQCTWFDLQISHDELSLATACVCKDEEGHSQSYGCQYTGELYSCDEYKTHSEEVLLGLIQQVSALNNSCEIPQLSTPACSEIVLERETLHRVQSPCVSNHQSHQEL